MSSTNELDIFPANSSLALVKGTARDVKKALSVNALHCSFQKMTIISWIMEEEIQNHDSLYPGNSGDSD